MGFLSKEAYAGKAEYASRRNTENKKITTLTPEQHDALAELCKIRHEIHSAGTDHIWGDQSILNDLFQIQDRVDELGLNCPLFYNDGVIDGDYIVCYDDYCDHTLSDEWQEAHDACLEDVDGNEDNPDLAFYIVDYMKSKLANQIEHLNSEIEAYLTNIDNQYGTSYAPTGMSRIF